VNRLNNHISSWTNNYLGRWGTIIPWAVIPVAAICGVHPADLVRKNIIPVSVGFIATVIVAIIIF